MKFSFKTGETDVENIHSLDLLQRIALGGMFLLAILTFVGANLHALLWQSSDWLVSTVLPSVVVNLTNEERAGLGEVTLQRSATLDAAARMKAEHMAKNQYFAHYAPDGTSPWYWFDKSGYVYAHAGENLAIHFTDSDEVVKAWMNSPTHRANIVSGKFTEIGVGTAKGTYEGYDTVYVVQLFGAPAVPQVVKTTAAPTKAPAPAATEPNVIVEADTPDVAGTDIGAPEPIEVTGIEEIEAVEPADPAIVVVPATETAPVDLPSDADVVVVEKELVATSSGLAVANIDEQLTPKKNDFFSRIATEPNSLLQMLYLFFGVIVVGLLITSIALEAKKNHKVQMAYGVGLLLVMVGLWYVHALLTMGAVVA